MTRAGTAIKSARSVVVTVVVLTIGARLF